MADPQRKCKGTPLCPIVSILLGTFCFVYFFFFFACEELPVIPPYPCSFIPWCLVHGIHNRTKNEQTWLLSGNAFVQLTSNGATRSQPFWPKHLIPSASPSFLPQLRGVTVMETVYTICTMITEEDQQPTEPGGGVLTQHSASSILISCTTPKP